MLKLIGQKRDKDGEEGSDAESILKITKTAPDDQPKEVIVYRFQLFFPCKGNKICLCP